MKKSKDRNNREAGRLGYLDFCLSQTTITPCFSHLSLSLGENISNQHRSQVVYHVIPLRSAVQL